MHNCRPETFLIFLVDQPAGLMQCRAGEKTLFESHHHTNFHCNEPFPSISYYFRIPIIFDFLDFHCPTEVMAVRTIIFPV
jgi:hypothetical protein